MAERKRTDVIQVDREPFGSPFVLALAAFSGPDCHAVHRITAREVTVGRSEEADFVINDSKISAVHFSVRSNGTLYSVIDLGSTNGTRLNGKKISPNMPVRMKNLDEIMVGKTKLLFLANRFRTDLGFVSTSQHDEAGIDS